MLGEVTALDLRLRRRSLYGYALGLGAYVLVIVALYPSFKNDTSLDQLTANGSAVAALFGATGPLTTPTGWLGANVYANFGPLIVLVLGIGYGAGCLAGQDEDGTLGLVVTLPLSRARIVLQKVAALILLALTAGLATLLAALVGRAFDLDVAPSGLIGVTVGMVLLGVDFGLVAMVIGAVTGSRGTALGTTSALAAASYLVASLAPVVHWLHPARYASLFFYAVSDQQLQHGLRPGWAAVLLAVAVLLVGGCVAAFDRLDVH
jgi:ABC-2 type transport system permease protein